MNSDVVINARKIYNDIIGKKKELIEIKEELLNVKNVKDFEECIKFIEKEEAKIPSDDEILRYSFYNNEQIDTSSNVYVFIGAYRRNEKGISDIRINDYQKADYFIYQDLEKMFSGKVIYPSEYKQFEQENIIIKIKNTDNVRKEFLRIQSIYFMEFLKDENISQDKVLKKINESL